jgi:endonuclease YncB( thermonuclease family)
MTRCLLVALAMLFALGPLSGCAVEKAPPPEVFTPAPQVVSTLPLTWTPPLPTPTYTLVIPPTATVTPGPSPTPTRLPARVRALVVGVEDSRTVDVFIDGQPLNRGFIVRLLGVDPPSLTDPWYPVAVEWLAQEIKFLVVVLESDENQEERDAQGSLLRYVWKEGRMLNVEIVGLGLATMSEDVSDLAYGEDLLEAQAEAQAAERGLWGPPPTATPTVTYTATLTGTQAPTLTLTITQTGTLTATQTPTATVASTLTR